MTSLGARVTMIEQVVTRLVASRGERVSTAMRLARQRSMAGEQVPVLRDVGEIEREARLPGLAGRIGRARLRAIRGFPLEALQAAYGRKDARGGGAGCLDTSAPATRSTGSTVPATATSERDLLLQRIDATLARANGHV